MQAQIPEFGGFFHPSWKLNELARLLVLNFPIVAPPLVLEQTPAGALLRLQTGAGFGLGTLQIRDLSGAPNYSDIDTIVTQYFTLTNPSTGVVLLVPQSAAYDVPGIINDVDQYLGKGQKTVEILGVGGTSAGLYPRLRRGRLIDSSGTVTDLQLALTQYQSFTERFGFFQLGYLNLISEDDTSGGLTGRNFSTFTNAISNMQIGVRGYGNGTSFGSSGQLPYLSAVSILELRPNYLSSAIPTYTEPDMSSIKLGLFVSPDETNQLRQVGIAERWHATQKFSVSTGLGGPHYYGITDTDALGNKFAGGIFYEKGTITSLPPSGPAGGDLTGVYPNPSVAANAITYPKIQIASPNTVLTRASATAGTIGETALGPSQLLGRGTSGNISPITLGTGLSMSGTTLSATGSGSPPPPQNLTSRWINFSTNGNGPPPTIQSANGCGLVFLGPLSYRVTYAATAGPPAVFVTPTFLARANITNIATTFVDFTILLNTPTDQPAVSVLVLGF